MKFKKMIGLVACTLVFNMMYGALLIEDVCAMDVAPTGTDVASLDVLQNRSNQKYLYLSRRDVTSLDELQNYPNLKELGLSDYIELTSLDVLPNCPNLL
jgi:Leucine-rich repeat (LRR) protein